MVCAAPFDCRGKNLWLYNGSPSLHSITYHASVTLLLQNNPNLLQALSLLLCWRAEAAQVRSNTVSLLLVQGTPSYFVQEQKEDNTVYHMWLRECLATALFQHLQSQGKLDPEDDLKHHVVYIKR